MNNISKTVLIIWVFWGIVNHSSITPSDDLSLWVLLAISSIVVTINGIIGMLEFIEEYKKKQ